MSKKILSPLRRDGYKAGMIMMLIALSTMLLTTACSSEDDLVNNNNEPTAKKGYELPVTVNVTRGDGATRATYNESTKKLEFSAYDKLFVSGSATGAGQFAGELDYVSEGTFSGTIYTENEYSGTAIALFTAASGDNLTATLLPNGYDANSSNSFLFVYDNGTPDTAYDDTVIADGSHAFVASETAKATGVEQLSYELATTYSSGFALAPVSAILNFTISGLEAGAQDVTLYVRRMGADYTVTGSVTPNASGVATFAVGVPDGANIKEGSNNLSVGSHNFTLPGGTALAAGKIYNIARSAASAPTGVLNGVFSVSSTKQVKFSKGNLQAKIASYASHSATASEWKFADSQDSYIGNAAGNTSFAADTWVDLFCWVGNSATYDTYGLITFTPSSQANNGNVADESLKTDWGTAAASSIGEGWRTLTSAEWTYLFNTRTVNNGTGSGKSYTWGKYVNGVLGVVLYPDDYTGAEYSGSDWSDFESAGCVFLPAAGRRNGTSVYTVGTYGGYWSSTAHGTGIAYDVYFYQDLVDPAKDYEREYGFSVRLVRDVQ